MSSAFGPDRVDSAGDGTVPVAGAAPAVAGMPAGDQVLAAIETILRELSELRAEVEALSARLAACSVREARDCSEPLTPSNRQIVVYSAVAGPVVVGVGWLAVSLFGLAGLLAPLVLVIGLGFGAESILGSVRRGSDPL